MTYGAVQFGDAIIGLFDAVVQNSDWKNYVMILVAFGLLYLAIVKDFEPLLLVPIGFGMLLINIPGALNVLGNSKIEGFIHYIGKGVDLVIYPPLVFLGIGAMTDFGPLIANPKSLIVGAASQVGIYITFIVATQVFGFCGEEAAAISIIGGADGPTTIFMTQKFIDIGRVANMQSAIIIAAYSYMALIPIIQPTVMKLLTTKKERLIKMKQLRPVSKREKIIFPIAVTVVSGVLLPDSLPLIGMLMFGNLLKECLVTDRLADTAANALINIVTIFLGLVVGTKSLGENFLTAETLKILALGLTAFIFSTAGGVLSVKIINLFSKNKMNPLIGNAGVSAIPMAARVSQKMGQKYDSSNYLLMHAMGPNVAGSIGSAVAAGIMLLIFGG